MCQPRPQTEQSQLFSVTAPLTPYLNQMLHGCLAHQGLEEEPARDAHHRRRAGLVRLRLASCVGLVLQWLASCAQASENRPSNIVLVLVGEGGVQGEGVHVVDDLGQLPGEPPRHG